MTISITCPTCNKPSIWNPSNLYRPFCSERCKLLDLGAWAEEKYRIPDNNTPSEAINDEDID
jgi:uncharacterized protein